SNVRWLRCKPIQNANRGKMPLLLVILGNTLKTIYFTHLEVGGASQPRRTTSCSSAFETSQALALNIICGCETSFT
ncbi:MAG: hypothetical protein PVG87_20475, partial [Desulfobacteraceae bacterium]